MVGSVVKDSAIKIFAARFLINFRSRPNSTLNLSQLKHALLLAAGLHAMFFLFAQQPETSGNPAGQFSLGTRNTFSIFNEDGSAGIGIGGQFRIRLGKKLNSEWFFDYISSRDGSPVYRNDYHIGWSLLFYPGNNYTGDRLLQPYFIAGHCFDKTVVTEKGNKPNNASRLSMATQAGLGTHINITSRFDLSLSGQYMLHFGKEIGVNESGEGVVITREDRTHAGGHLLFTLSFNYKLFRLWASR